MEVIIWSKDDCPYCKMAKQLCERRGVGYEERNLSAGNWRKEDLLELVPNARTLPQIFIDGEWVGGYQELNERLK